MRYVLVLLALSLCACKSEKGGEELVGSLSAATDSTVGPVGATGSTGATGPTGASNRVSQSFRCKKHIETGSCGGVSFRYSVNILESGDKFITCWALTDKMNLEFTRMYKVGEPGHSTSECVLTIDHNNACGAAGVGNYTFTTDGTTTQTVFTNTPVHVDGSAYPEDYLHNSVTTFVAGDCNTY